MSHELLTKAVEDLTILHKLKSTLDRLPKCKLKDAILARITQELEKDLTPSTSPGYKAPSPTVSR